MVDDLPRLGEPFHAEATDRIPFIRGAREPVSSLLMKQPLLYVLKLQFNDSYRYLL